MNARLATPRDAEAGSSVLRRSISELCHADHAGDPAIIAAWTANKTPDSWLAWLAQPGASLFVIERATEIIGVGMVDGGGTILLNYVAPEARYQGVSTTLLKAMEDASARRGLATCRLESTKTAQRFYIARGYEPLEGAISAIMAKPLAETLADHPKPKQTDG
ncbi:MAG: GNAT family N-acetyltransferase [Methylobacterium sp.]|uniref:GNAT family N-acetyltransferase n=1 Tax=Methylobacterium sp. TaxID=409 RepID=UPI000FC2E9C6|nr:GNAT family N-acetyltransferase [Methylobacterium sp.]RUP14230.1 MAG: GNAT family N-acetyltransferase [Methylobacterium sp.]